MMAGNDAVTVRPATPRDLPGLRRVAVETWRATYRGQIPDEDIERFLEANYRLADLERILERVAASGHSERMLVALAGDEVVGYAMAGPNQEGEAELFAIYVLPGEQGRGVGYRLWERVRSYFHDQGFERFVLWVLEGNRRARAFYERQGGRVTGERPYPVGETEIRELRYEFTVERPA